MIANAILAFALFVQVSMTSLAYIGVIGRRKEVGPWTIPLMTSYTLVSWLGLGAFALS